MTNSTSLIAILTSHNRRAQTLACLRSFFAQQVDGVALHAVLVDDGSSDGTADAVAAEFRIARFCTAAARFIGPGAWPWLRRKHFAPSRTTSCGSTTMWCCRRQRSATLIGIATAASGRLVVSGALVDPVSGVDSYGAMRRVDWHPLRYALVRPNGSLQDADTCNGNVLLVPAETLRVVGGIDGGFEHGYADFDYGLRVRKAGGRVVLSPTAGRHLLGEHVICGAGASCSARFASGCTFSVTSRVARGVQKCATCAATRACGGRRCSRSRI